MSPAQRGGYAACVTRRDGLPERQREKIIMRIPQQVAERVKEAPAQALRAVFSGIGQVLLVADRVKSRVAEPERAQPPAPSSSGQDVAKDEIRRRSLDETGNVRLLAEEDQPPTKSAEAPEPPAAEPGPTAAEAKAPAAEPEPAAAKAPTAEAKPAEPPTAHTEPTAEPAAPDQAALPVPNYDDLTLASLRARLRNLDQSQVRTLLDYEKAHAGRPDVLTMFERRIAKLESGGA
jgi:hypothetical protein